MSVESGRDRQLDFTNQRTAEVAVVEAAEDTLYQRFGHEALHILTPYISHRRISHEYTWALGGAEMANHTALLLENWMSNDAHRSHAE